METNSAPLPSLDQPITPVAKGAGRPKAAELEARHQCLMHTAARLFLDKGFGNVSLDMIAKEARVAVRTIYVKYGGKVGLLHAAMVANRKHFFEQIDLSRDTRPLREVVGDFADRFFNLITSEPALALQRMLAGEAKGNPELIAAFFAAGPNVTRDMIRVYFDRPDVQAQLYPDTPIDQIPVHLLNCIMGDHMSRVLMAPNPKSREQQVADMHQRLELFYRSVLKPAA